MKQSPSKKKQQGMKRSQKRPASAKPYKGEHSGLMYFDGSVSSERGSKMICLTDAKMIPTIHAYNPQSLKKCVIANPKTYKRFYDQKGSCELTKLYTTSFLAYFREWRRGLRERIISLLDDMTGHDVVEEKAIADMLKEMKGIVEEIKQSLDSILESKYSSTSAGEIKKQKASFESLREYLESLLVIVQYLCRFLVDINAIMEEEQQVMEGQKRIRKLAKKYNSKVMESLMFCSCHPESSLVNKAEYKLKKKFDQVEKWALGSLQTREKMLMIKEQFMINISRVMDTEGDTEYYSVPVLQQIAEVLNTNDEFRLHNKHIFEGPPSKALKAINQLNQEIDEHEVQFLTKFKLKSFLILKNEADFMKGQTVLKSLTSHPQTFKTARKKLLLLSKIYNRHQDRDYSEELGKCLQDTYDGFSKLQAFVEKIGKKSKDKRYQSHNENITVLNDILESVESYEEEQAKVCQAFLVVLLNSDYRAEDLEANNSQGQMSESEKIDKLITVLNGSEFETNKVLEAHKYGPCSQKITEGKMREVIAANNQRLTEMETNIFPRMVQFSAQLKSLSKDRLVREILIFDDDIDREPIHCFNLLKEFHKTMYSGVSSGSTRRITKEAVLKMIDYFHEKVKAGEEFRNCQIVRNYIEWMFENRVAMYLLQSMESVNAIIDDPVNQTFHRDGSTLKQKRCFEGRPKVRKFIGVQHEVFEAIVDASKQYVMDKSLFDCYFGQCLTRLKDFMHKQAIFMDFKASAVKSTYFPSVFLLERWLNWEFSFHIEDSINESLILRIRAEQKELLGKMVNRLKGLVVESDKQYQLGRQFVDECGQKMSTITQLLLPLTESLHKSKQDRMEEKYKRIAGSVLKFLRVNNLYHIAICANNEDPITFLPQGSLKDLETILGVMEKKLGLPPNSIDRSNNGLDFFSIFQPTEIANEIMKMHQNHGLGFLLQAPQGDQQGQTSDKKPEGGQKDDGALFFMGNNEMEEDLEEMKEDIEEAKFEEEMEEVIGEEGIGEEMIGGEVIGEERIGEEVIGEEVIGEEQERRQQEKEEQENNLQIDSNIEAMEERSGHNFLLGRGLGTESSMQEGEGGPDEAKRVYLRLKNLEDLRTMKGCLRFAREEYLMLRRGLEMGELVKALNPVQPNRELVQHLQEVLEKCSQNTLSGLMKIRKQYSKMQSVVNELKVSLGSKDRQQRTSKFNNLMTLFDFKYETLYGQIFTSDFIVLFQLEERGHYVHAMLTREQGFLQAPFVPHSDIEAVEAMFVDSIFGVESEKNKNLDQIRRRVQGVNARLEAQYTQVREQVQGYKQYPVDNGLETDQYVDQYIGRVTRGESLFSQVQEVSYSSYRAFLEEAMDLGQHPESDPCQFSCQHGDQLHLLLVHWDYDSLRKLIHESGLLIPAFSSDSFIERRNAKQVVLKFKELEEHALGQKISIKGLNMKEVLAMLTNAKGLPPHKDLQYRNMGTEISQLLEAHKQPCSQLIKTGKVLAIPEEMTQRVNQLQAQRDILTLLFESQAEDAAFILPDEKGCDEELVNFQKKETQQFLMEAPKYKRQMGSDTLERVHQLLTAAQCPHKVITHQGSVIGIAGHQLSEEAALEGTLNCADTAGFTFKSRQDGLEIEIDKLFVNFRLAECMDEPGRSSLANIDEVFGQYMLVIKNEDTLRSVRELRSLMSAPLQIQVAYPRSSIEFTLQRAEEVRKNGGVRRWEKVATNCLTQYQYGAEYSLLWLEEIVGTVLDEEVRKEAQRLQEIEMLKKKQEERILQEEERRRKDEERRLQEEENKRKEEEEENKRKEEEEERKRKEEEETRLHYNAMIGQETKVVVDGLLRAIMHEEIKNQMLGSKGLKRIKSEGSIPAAPGDVQGMPSEVQKIYGQEKTQKDSEGSDQVSEVSFVLSVDLDINQELLEMENQQIYQSSTLGPYLSQPLRRAKKKITRGRL